jgi:hypothetical protein
VRIQSKICGEKQWQSVLAFLNAEEEEHKTENGVAPKTLKFIHSNFVPIPETIAVGCKVCN